MAGEKLGIFVTTDKHLDHLLGICKALEKSGREAIIFLSSRGVLLTQQEKFKEIESLPMVISLCNVGFEHFKLQKPVPVVKDEDFATQMRHAEMIEDCDRYLVL